MQQGRLDPGVLHHVRSGIVRDMEPYMLALKLRKQRREDTLIEWNNRRGISLRRNKVPGHTTFEAFMHSLDTGDAWMDHHNTFAGEKPAAPIELRALVACVRSALAPRLLAALHGSTSTFAQILRSKIAAGGLFADADLQVHAGTAVKNSSDIFWHTDAANSALHLAISLFGRRRLHAHCGSDCGVSVTEHTAGSVYLSSPAAFVHGVEYPLHAGGRFAQSIVSVQARILLNHSDRAALEVARGENQQPAEGAIETFALIARTLAHGPALALPSFHELRRTERVLRRSRDEVLANRLAWLPW